MAVTKRTAAGERETYTSCPVARSDFLPHPFLLVTFVSICSVITIRPFPTCLPG